MKKNYEDVLQNLEYALLSVNQEHSEICDHDVLRVVQAAITYYKSSKRDTSTHFSQLSTLEQKMFTQVTVMCDWRLGLKNPGLKQIELELKSIDEIILCLKRIEKSIKFWTKLGGRHGYINFATPRVLI